MIKNTLFPNGIIPAIFKRKNVTNSPHWTEARNWQEIKDKKNCLQKIEATLTPSWSTGWYKNPSSGRSINYGVTTENPQEHSTVVIKGGCFFIDQKIKKTLSDNSIFMGELYGNISFETAKKEYEIASLIQKRFESLLHKKANCPQPLEYKEVTHVLCKNKSMALADFFKLHLIGEEQSKISFTMGNFVKTAGALGIDIMYPMSEVADNETRKNPYSWLISQCLEKAKPAVYRYKIDGPNTRLRDLMTLEFSERQKYFIEANTGTGISDALEKFASKLAEFYALLHKVGIGYHAGYSEHCTLIDTTISGVVMDIGGLSEEYPVQHDREGFIVQVINTANLLAYLCKNIFKTDANVYEKVMNVFWEKYQSIYWDGNLKYFAENRDMHNVPRKIRTRYVDSHTGNRITLAHDLRDLSTDPKES